MTEKKRKWIKSAVAEGKGKLHEHLHVPKDEKIPEEKLRDALKSKDPKIRKEANLAMTLKGMHHPKKGNQSNSTPVSPKSMRAKMYGAKE